MDRPIILIKRLFTKLMEGLEGFLVNNQTVKTLVLEALPIQGIHMTTFINVKIFSIRCFVILLIMYNFNFEGPSAKLLHYRAEFGAQCYPGRRM